MKKLITLDSSDLLIAISLICGFWLGHFLNPLWLTIGCVSYFAFILLLSEFSAWWRARYGQSD